MSAIGICFTLLAVAFAILSVSRRLRLKPVETGYASQRMCPECGLITPRSKPACLECGKTFVGTAVARRDRE
jgi:hypothetical protein